MKEVLKQLGILETNEGLSSGKNWIKSSGKKITSFSPVDGKSIASVNSCDDSGYEQAIKKAESAFLEWRMYPSPKRGEIVRQFGEALRKNKESLGKLVSFEM